MAKGPNILFIMADQMAGPALPIYGHKVVKAPNISALAESGVAFENCYCNSPLCAPSRFSLMAGQLPSHLGAYDNAAEFHADIPTFAHYLRAAGYRTCLSGKMHFVGPDQLHGFEERLTTDIYPADFGWTPDWDRPDERLSWYHNMLSVVQAGQCLTSNQLDFDEEVTFHAVRKLYDWARDADDRPFCLVVSFTHPHDPYVVTKEYWDRYDHAEIDRPSHVLTYDQLDGHSQRVWQMCAMGEFELTPERVRNARHAYYAEISYVDDKVGQLLRALDAIGQREDTVVIFASDHGDMLGERGLWYKMTFFEWSARVPLIFNAPGRFAPRRVSQNVSLVDLLPTLVDVAAADGGPTELAGRGDGLSLRPLLHGHAASWPDTALSEYLGEGAVGPCLMIKRGQYKYLYSYSSPDQLYDLAADPRELHNLADDPGQAERLHAFQAEVQARWDPEILRQTIIANQRGRRLVARSLMTGAHTAWDFQPFQDATRQYMRNNLDLNDLERRARYPAPPIPER